MRLRVFDVMLGLLFQRCTFCKEPGAPTGCIEKKCNTKYHFGCGRQNGVLFQFFGSFW